MRRLCLVFAILQFLGWTASRALSADFSVSLLGGYKGGPGVRVGGMVSEFARGFPLSLDAALAYTSREPGNSADARRIFINDATDGTPEKSGRTWDARLDFLYRIRMLGLEDAHLLVGVRYSMFTGNFVYVGGNEDFDVTSNQWGVGLGMKASFPMVRSLALTLLAGVDNYFPATLSGHDTSYSPDGETVNGRRDYTYRTADEAIRQPKFVPILMIGLTWGV